MFVDASHHMQRTPQRTVSLAELNILETGLLCIMRQRFFRTQETLRREEALCPSDCIMVVVPFIPAIPPPTPLLPLTVFVLPGRNRTGPPRRCRLVPQKEILHQQTFLIFKGRDF